MGDDLSRVTDERGEQLVLDRRQADLGGSQHHPTPQQVHLELADLEGRVVGLVGRAGRVPEGHADTGQQLAGAERLADIVVSARIERRDLVPLHPARRQHDDRHVAPFTHPADDFETIDIGQAQIDDHHVGLARADLDEAVGACPRFEEAVALPDESGSEETADLWLVLDQNDDGIRH